MISCTETNQISDTYCKDILLFCIFYNTFFSSHTKKLREVFLEYQGLKPIHPILTLSLFRIILYKDKKEI